MTPEELKKAWQGLPLHLRAATLLQAAGLKTTLIQEKPAALKGIKSFHKMGVTLDLFIDTANGRPYVRVFDSIGGALWYRSDEILPNEG